MHFARQSFFVLLQLFKHQKAEGDGGGELRQSRKAGSTVAGRFPVVGGHGKQGFQLGGGHGDGALHLTLINSAKARVLHLLHRVFVGLFVEHGLHLVQMLCPRHNVGRSCARPGAAPG